MSEAAELIAAQDRLREFISDHLRGQCKVFSQGDACQCALCDFDRMRAAIAHAQSCEVDAARYRWLRANKHWALLVGESGFGFTEGQVEHWTNERNESLVDDGVDAGMVEDSAQPLPGWQCEHGTIQEPDTLRAKCGCWRDKQPAQSTAKLGGEQA